MNDSLIVFPDRSRRPLENFNVSGKTLYFTVQGAPFSYEWLVRSWTVDCVDGIYIVEAVSDEEPCILVLDI